MTRIETEISLRFHHNCKMFRSGFFWKLLPDMFMTFNCEFVPFHVNSCAARLSNWITQGNWYGCSWQCCATDFLGTKHSPHLWTAIHAIRSVVGTLQAAEHQDVSVSVRLLYACHTQHALISLATSPPLKAGHFYVLSWFYNLLCAGSSNVSPWVKEFNIQGSKSPRQSLQRRWSTAHSHRIQFHTPNGSKSTMAPCPVKL